MTKEQRSSIIVAGIAAAWLWGGTAGATPTPDQKCAAARTVAWGKFQECIAGPLALDAGPPVARDTQADFAKCRHRYFKQWAKFQARGSLAGTTCAANRFVDNGATVTDNLTALVWEKKTDDDSVHDKDYWVNWSTGAPYRESGTAAQVANDIAAAGLGGTNDWRLPKLTELQSILLDYPCTSSSCTCPLTPCIDSVFGPVDTVVNDAFWSSTSQVGNPAQAWLVSFAFGSVWGADKTGYVHFRVVRGGL
jgi:hypothetical protein